MKKPEETTEVREKKFLLRNLVDADCDENTIRKYLALEKLGKKKEQLRLLYNHRCSLLDNLHTAQEKIDCLDYLIYKIKK